MSEWVYHRPKTRGELRDKINEGIPCEVVSYVAEMTSSLLRGWLQCENFQVRPSENDGWVVFEKTKGE